MWLFPLLPWWYIQHRNQPTERKNPQNTQGCPELKDLTAWSSLFIFYLQWIQGPDKLRETQSLGYGALPPLCRADNISKAWAIRPPEVQSENWKRFLSVVHLISASVKSYFSLWPWARGNRDMIKLEFSTWESLYSHTCSYTSSRITFAPRKLSKSHFCQLCGWNLFKNFNQAHL